MQEIRFQIPNLRIYVVSFYVASFFLFYPQSFYIRINFCTLKVALRPAPSPSAASGDGTFATPQALAARANRVAARPLPRQPLPPLRLPTLPPNWRWRFGGQPDLISSCTNPFCLQPPLFSAQSFFPA